MLFSINQWYYGSGHPNLEINYDYDVINRLAKVYIKQTQTDKIFKLPVAIDIYIGNEKKRHQVWVQNVTDTFSFSVSSKPDLINFDGDKILLCQKKENKTLDNYIEQYKYAGLYLDRREAIDFASKLQEDPKAVSLLKTALNDKFYNLRIYTLGKLNLNNDSIKMIMEPVILTLANKDPKATVRAKAIEILGRYKKETYKTLFEKALKDSSYSVAGNALDGLSKIDSAGALNAAKELSKFPAKGKLAEAITRTLVAYGDENTFDFIADNFNKMPLSQSKFSQLQSLSSILGKIQNTAQVKKGVDMIVNFRDGLPLQVRNQTNTFINNFILKGLASKKEAAGLKEQADYIKSKIPVPANP